MKVVVGLGNPGAKYHGTRHNIGFAAVDYLAADPRCEPFRAKFQSLVAECKVDGETVLLVKPETFMNLSGRAVRAALDFYKLTADDLLVICDDYNLPLGKLRLRAQGSSGGQNGLKDIQAALGSDAYPRLRLGVGQPGPGEAVDFVLSRFKPGERAASEDAVARSAQAVLIWVRQGLPAAMNFANAGETVAKPKKPRPDAKDGDKATGDAKKDDEKAAAPPPTGGGGPAAKAAEPGSPG